MSSEMLFTDEQRDLIRRTVAAGCNADEFAQFMYMVEKVKLDPIARQIHAVKRQGKMTIQVGIDGFRVVADRTGLYAGSDDARYTGANANGYPAEAYVVVYKMVAGQRCPFSATARWDEYFPGDSQGFQWKRMPHAMLSKCAEALALRKAFPADLSGLYTDDEMAQAGKAEPPKDQPVNAVETAALIGYEMMCEKHNKRFDEAEYLAVHRAGEWIESIVGLDYVPAYQEHCYSLGLDPYATAAAAREAGVLTSEALSAFVAALPAKEQNP